MSVLVACVLSFCADLTGPHNLHLYNAHVKADALKLLNNLNVHGLSFIHQEVLFYVQMGIEKEITDVYRNRYRDVLRQLRLAGKEAEEHQRNPRNCLRTYRDAAKKNVTEFVRSLAPCVQPIHSEYVNITQETIETRHDAGELQQRLNNLDKDTANCTAGQKCFENEVNKLEREYDRIRIIHSDLLERRSRLLEELPNVINCIRWRHQEIDDKLNTVLNEGTECIKSS